MKRLIIETTIAVSALLFYVSVAEAITITVAEVQNYLAVAQGTQAAIVAYSKKRRLGSITPSAERHCECHCGITVGVSESSYKRQN